MKNVYDVGIIGSGVAGSLAALQIVEKYPQCKAVLFDIGRPPGKRRRQLEGFLGAMPAGDGKLYLNNLQEILKICDSKKINFIYNSLMDWMENFGALKITKDSSPSASMKKKLLNDNWLIETNDYIQWKPENIHAWAKDFADKLENAPNVTFCYDTEIDKVLKQKNIFHLYSDYNSENKTFKEEFLCKKIILATGRSGWRSLKEILEDLEIPFEDEWAEYGIRAEISSQQLKDFNKSHCKLTKENLTVGPFSWSGSVIPEDHAGLVISSFRSNEERWKTDKVSFSITKKIHFPNVNGKQQGTYQADRLGQLAFILANNRVSKEKIKTLMTKETELSLFKEFEWLYSEIENLTQFIPNLINKGYFYVPTLIAHPPRVKLNQNLESEISGVYLVGEAANKFGILSAALMGILSADSICRESDL